MLVYHYNENIIHTPMPVVVGFGFSENRAPRCHRKYHSEKNRSKARISTSYRDHG
jgi:hypothetical protein